MGPTGLHSLALGAAFAIAGGCANERVTAPSAVPAASQSILEMSIPAAGSTVNGPVNELMLHFNPPARLDEVTVTGPDGSMPMMITPVGETATYKLPLSGLRAGVYAVSWRASSGGQEYRGSFGFTVR